MKTLLRLIVVLIFAATASGQTTTFVPNCGGDDDTNRIASLVTRIGDNTGTIRLPYKAEFRCAVGNMTIPANITLDNSDGTGIAVKSGATLLVLGPVVNPVGKPIFFGPGTTSFAGNTFIGSAGQALLSGGDGTTAWGNVGGGGPGGPTTGTGATVLQTNPTLITPILGDAEATTINKLTITPPASGATLTIANGKTLTVNNTLTLSGTDGNQLVLGQPLTIGGSAGVTINGGGTLALGGNTGTLPTTGTFALGAGSLSVSSTNNSSTAAHTHGITSSANPGATASLLATNPSGFLQLERLGIGTSPTRPLEVAGDVLINAATANLFLKDTSTGWQAASTMVVNPLPNNSVCTNNYTSGLLGWCINAAGNAEFNNVDVRGAIRSSLFIFNAIQSTAGTLGVFKSAAKLRTDVTIPSSPVYGTTTVNIDVVDAEGILHANSQLFVVNDILRMKEGLIGDTWLRVASVSDQGTHWRYNSTVMAGSANVTYRSGLAVADYGQSGQGFIILTADQANSPFEQMATHAGTFTSLNAGGTLIVTPQLRIGNLNGSYGYASDTYGFAAGQRAPGQSWISVDSVNGVRIGNNTTTLTQIDAAGNASFTGSVTASSGTIASWTINADRLSSFATHIASNFDFPATGVLAWFGRGATGYAGWNLRDSADRGIHALVNNGSTYPFMGIFDGTRYRVVLGGMNSAFCNDGSLDAVGMKICDSSGNVLAQFHSLANTIANWTITQNRLSAGSGAATVGLDATVTGGDDVRIFAGSATPGSAPFRVTEGGVLVATNANITGAITANSGQLSGVNITGLLSMSAVGSAITIGTSPPTSASSGTGIWIDRTGLYGLSGGTVQAQIDATTGAILAGTGKVKLNAAGLTMESGSAGFNAIRWQTVNVDDARIFSTLSGGTRQWGVTVNDQFTGAIGGQWSSTVYNKNGGGISFTMSADSNGTSGGQSLTWASISAIDFDVTGGTFSPPSHFGLAIKRSSGAADGTTGIPAESAILDLQGTTGALLITRLTTTERDALSSPQNGMVFYNTTTGKFQGRAGGAWIDLH
jgi:hypothetical protein